MVKTTQIDGFNSISIEDISTPTLKDSIRYKELKVMRDTEELICMKEELTRRGE